VSKEIVISAYDKAIDWISELNEDIKKTVYRKGKIIPLSSGEIFVELNLGRCVHTFFNHLYKNYNNLSEYTYFAQDYPFDHWGNLIDVINDDTLKMETSAELKIGGYYGYHNNTLGSAWSLGRSQQFENGVVLVCSSNGHPQDKNPLIDVDKYWYILFDVERPISYEFIPGGHFCITREHAQLRSRELYKKITELLIEDVTAPWMVERLECYIFNPAYKTKL
jgi:hypothetical protein